MSVFEIIEKRRSIRKYKDQPIEKEKIDKLLEAARLAPSAGNKQKYKFIIVDNEDIKKQLAVACNNQIFVGTASHIIAGTTEIWKWDKVDVAIALEHIVLESIELGLGTCWIGAFNEKEIKRILNIPEDKIVVALLTVGYPDEFPLPKPRKNEIFSYNKY